MTEQGDYRVREIGNTLVTMRADLIVSPRQAGADKYYVIQDPLTSKFFRIGVTEYTFASLLDGSTSIHQALRLLSNALPNHQLSPQDATGICHWLLQSNLAHTPESRSGNRIAASGAQAEERRTLQRCNPLVCKLPLGNPNQLFERLAPLVRWLYSPWGVAGWLVLLILAGYRVALHWQPFLAASRDVFAPHNWVWLGAGWLFLKVVHELAHGTVCKKYGGHVRESGILLVVLAPLAYVDVSSSWQFRSSWQRIYTAAAGMHMELLIAAIAALVWNPANDTQLNHICVNLVLMASVTTLLFNANPLMKFDGYYILSDVIGIPNLNTSAQQYLRGLGRYLFLGMPRQRSPWTRGRAAVIGIYAILAFLWRITVTVSLTVAASLLFHGAGIVLAGLAIVLWLGLPTFQFLKYMIAGRPGDQPNARRFALAFGMLATVASGVLTLVPWPGALQAPAIVAYATDYSVRAATPGFVQEVLVESGQRVEAGQPLVVIDNPEISDELADLKLAIAQAEIQCRVLKQKQKLAAYQAEIERRTSLQQQLMEKQLQVDHLTIRAPAAGTLVATNLESLVGTYLREGTELGAIGDPSDKQLRVSIDQDDLSGFKNRVGDTVSVFLPGAPKVRGRLHEVDPRASVRPSHQAFCAVNQGPIAVRRADESPDDETGGDVSLEYLAPRFVGIVDLSPGDQQLLACGQLGTVSCRPFRETIGQHLVATVQDWVERLRQRAQPRT